MKSRCLIFLLLSCLAFGSCHKNETEKERFVRKLPGDYDWTVSTSLEKDGASGNPLYSYSPENKNKNYGLRIRKNEKCFLFEDGRQVDSGKLISVEDSVYSTNPYGSITYYKVTINWSKNADMLFVCETEQAVMRNTTYPFSQFTNVFSIQ